MRRLVLLVVLGFVAPADAQPVVRVEPPSQPAPRQPAPRTENPDAKYEWKGPSGFWTNPRPAKGGAYRWGKMAVGGVVLAFTAFMILRLVKKANAERAARK